MSQPTAGNARAPAKAAGSSASSGTSAPAHVQEFTVRIPKNLKKMHHVMRFNANLGVDFAQWKNVKMERENNMRDARAMEEEMPKFGGGSEFNRDMKEDFRRKKFGFQPRKYKQEAQPWILKVGGKSGKKFRGIREGGVSAYASFYVFAHAPDGCIEAYPLNEWYNFQPIQRYKALSAEEAEQEFGRRNRVINHFQLMMRHRLKGDEDGQDDPEEAKLKLSGKKGKEFKISDADDIMMDSDDDSDSDDEDKDKKKDDDSDADSKKKKGKKLPPKKKKKNKGSDDDEAFEESDDGDEEGRELDYIESSDSDESDPELQVDKEMKSVAEEDGLRKLLTSDEDSEEEKNSSDESSKEEEKAKKEAKENNAKEKKKLKSKKPKDGDKKESLSDFSSDSSDSEAESKRPKKLNGNSTNNSRSASPNFDAGPSGLKRKLPSDLGSAGNSNGASENSNSPTVTPAKKTKYDAPSLPASFAGVISSNKDDSGITEEAVRRYLMRKPMTTTELLTKFKNKKTGVSSDKLVETMTSILKKINPIKQTIQGKMYLSIKNK